MGAAGTFSAKVNNRDNNTTIVTIEVNNETYYLQKMNRKVSTDLVN